MTGISTLTLLSLIHDRVMVDQAAGTYKGMANQGPQEHRVLKELGDGKGFMSNRGSERPTGSTTGTTEAL